MLQNTDEEVTEVAAAIEKTVGCDAIQIIGRVIVLFQPSTKEKYQRISSRLPRVKAN